MTSNRLMNLAATGLLAVGLSVVLGRGLSAEIAFLSTFKSPDAGRVSFGGKKVAALVMGGDDSLRIAGEEALASELNARGMQAVPTYRIAPKEELQKAETAKPWFERAGVEGVMAIRLVSADSRQVYSPVMWASSTYSQLWGYYGYASGAVWTAGSNQRETTIVVETTIYSLPLNQLLWAAVSETRDPKNVRSFVEDLVKQSVKEMEKQGLAGGGSGGR